MMKYRSVVFDFDSTLVDVETLESISEITLEGRADRDAVTSEVRRITELGMEGKIAFDESLSRRMALISPHRSNVQKVANTLVAHITPSVLEHKDFFERNADVIYIVSGGFDELIFPVSDVLVINRSHVFANNFLYDESGKVIGVDVSRSLSQQLGKVKALNAASLPRPLAMVGDGYTDYEVRAHGAADVFIAYVEHTHRESVVVRADCIARSFNEVLACLEGKTM